MWEIESCVFWIHVKDDKVFKKSVDSKEQLQFVAQKLTSSHK